MPIGHFYCCAMDPQRDEDEHIKNVRARSALWYRYAQMNRLNADTLEWSGDRFGARLCLARAAVRQAAAELTLASTPHDAATEMHRRAAALWQLDLPFAGFDEAAVHYVEARTWQDCARALDPSLPVVQPRLAWD
jgi:hypothetical protein